MWCRKGGFRPGRGGGGRISELLRVPRRILLCAGRHVRRTARVFCSRRRRFFLLLARLGPLAHETLDGAARAARPAPASRPRAQVRAAQLAHPGADHLGRVDGRRVTVGSRWLIRRFSTGPQSGPRAHVSSTREPVAGVGLASEGVRSLPPVAPALHSGAEDSRAAERQRPSGRDPRARKHRLQARLAQEPTPTVPTIAACARRAFRGTRVVARRNALAGSSSSTTPSGPARPLRLASVPRPGMTNSDVRLATHPGDRTRQRPRCGSEHLPRARCRGPTRTHTPMPMTTERRVCRHACASITRPTGPRPQSCSSWSADPDLSVPEAVELPRSSGATASAPACHRSPNNPSCGH